MPHSASASDSGIQILPGPRAEFGESPFFDARDGSVVYVDTLGSIIRHGSGDECARWPVGQGISFAVPSVGGGYIVGLAQRGICRFDPISGSVDPIGVDLPTGHQSNDATLDAEGRLIFGTRSTDKASFDGALFAVDEGGSRMIAQGFGLINGLAVDARAGRLFVADTHPDIQAVWRYDYDLASGKLGYRQEIFDFKSRQGRPDGAALDADGNLWLAEIGGSAIVCLSPDGVLLDDIALPVSMPTKLCFNASNRLFITTASRGIDRAREPAAGRMLGLDMAGATITALAAV